MKDENDRLREGTLPDDPFKDTEPLGEDGKPIAEDNEFPRGTGDEAPPPPPLLAHWTTIEALRALTEKPEPRRYLLAQNIGERMAGVIPLGKVGMLVAEGGAGKTLALCQLALSVACLADDADDRTRVDRSWLGLLRPEAPGRVLLALGEEDADEVRRRMYWAAHHMKLTKEETALAEKRIEVLPLAGVPCAFVEGDGRGNAHPTPALEALRARVREQAAKAPYRLLLLDPLSRWAGADSEKDNAAATRFVQALETLVDRRNGDGSDGPALLIAHHIPKVAKGANAAANPSARGVSGLTDGVRLEARLTVHKTWKRAEGSCPIRSFQITKSNYGPTTDKTYLAMEKDGSRLHALSDKETSEYEEWLTEKDTRKTKLAPTAKASPNGTTAKTPAGRPDLA